MNVHGPGWSEVSPEEGNSAVYLSVKSQAAVKHKLSARSEKDEKISAANCTSVGFLLPSSIHLFDHTHIASAKVRK